MELNSVPITTPPRPAASVIFWSLTNCPPLPAATATPADHCPPLNLCRGVAGASRKPWMAEAGGRVPPGFAAAAGAVGGRGRHARAFSSDFSPQAIPRETPSSPLYLQGVTSGSLSPAELKLLIRRSFRQPPADSSRAVQLDRAFTSLRLLGEQIRMQARFSSRATAPAPLAAGLAASSLTAVPPTLRSPGSKGRRPPPGDRPAPEPAPPPATCAGVLQLLHHPGRARRGDHRVPRLCRGAGAGLRAGR